MNVPRTWTWVGWLAMLGCAPGTKSGGMIVDTDDGGETNEATEDGTQSTETGDAPVCAPPPSCGNEIVEALEECDADIACPACESTQSETTLVDGGGIAPAVILPDGSAFGVVESEKGAIPLLRRWDAAGDMQWSVAFAEGRRVSDIAVDESGNVYLAGGQFPVPMEPNTEPIVWSYEGDGTPRWEVSPGNEGWVSTIATREGRVVAAGARTEGDGYVARLHAFEGEVVSLWEVDDTELSWIDDLVFVGDEMAAVGLAGDVAKLVRYDADGNRLWSLALPDDGEPDEQSRWAVISDGGAGTWALGQVARAAYVARHDAEGNLVQEIECIGGAAGTVVHAAIDVDGILALAVSFQGYVNQNYQYHAWFPVIVGDAIATATTFSSSTQTAFPFAVAWRDDGARVLGWTDYGSEGGPGQSRIVVTE